MLTPLFAIVDPVSGAVAGLFVLTATVFAPVTFIVHCYRKKFFRTWWQTTAIYTSLLVLIAIVSDWNAPVRLEYSIRIALCGGIFALVWSFVAGLPVLAYQAYETTVKPLVKRKYTADSATPNSIATEPTDEREPE